MALHRTGPRGRAGEEACYSAVSTIVEREFFVYFYWIVFRFV